MRELKRVRQEAAVVVVMLSLTIAFAGGGERERWWTTSKNGCRFNCGFTICACIDLDG